ncbi:MAG: PAS domain-containing protein, partial [Syntrophobacteraceae bacterium]
MTLRIHREQRLFVLGASIIMIIVFGAVFWDTLNITKISGNYYQRIARDKDLIADILPPPEFIIEPYLIMYKMLDETDKAKLEQLAAKSRELRDKYEAVHEFWAGTLPEGKTRDELIVASYRLAEEFFEIRDKQVNPAILRGDNENAHNLIRDLLTPKYEEHRRAVENVVGMTREAISREERESAGIVGRRPILLVLLVGIGIIGLALLHRRAEKFLSAEMERLAVTLRSIGDAVVATDKSGRVLLLNKVAEDLTGWTQEESAGRFLPEIFHIINETTRECCANAVEKVLETGRIVG